MIPVNTAPKEESTAWPLGDPVERLKNHLIGRGLWSEERQAQAESEYNDEIRAATKKAESYGVMGSGASPARYVR